MSPRPPHKIGPSPTVLELLHLLQCYAAHLQHTVHSLCFGRNIISGVTRLSAARGRLNRRAFYPSNLLARFIQQFGSVFVT